MSDVKTELLKNETVRRQIAERAYLLAENHHFAPGREMEFWLTAEEEVISTVLPANGTANSTSNGKPAPIKAVRKAAAKPVVAKVIESAVEAPVKAAPRKRAVKKADA